MGVVCRNLMDIVTYVCNIQMLHLYVKFVCNSKTEIKTRCWSRASKMCVNVGTDVCLTCDPLRKPHAIGSAVDLHTMIQQKWHLRSWPWRQKFGEARREHVKLIKDGGKPTDGMNLILKGAMKILIDVLNSVVLLLILKWHLCLIWLLQLIFFEWKLHVEIIVNF